MVSNQHYIELFINNNLIELESQTSLNLRINNVLFNPTKTTTTQASYSYSFDIPSTPRNDKILDYANNLSKLNKFHARYDSKVYADGQLIFEGSITIQKYSAKKKKYTCNLVSIKQNTLEDIFGEEVMTNLHWDVDFDGASSINSVNSDENAKYCFPLVCYGVFQKNYVTTDSVGSSYTKKSEIDKYNKWWIETFYPSLNVVETMKKAFESKGYTVGGSAFSDKYISNIYASCNLDDEQVPIYNVGNPKFGSVNLYVEWSNSQSSMASYDTNNSSSNSSSNHSSTGTGSRGDSVSYANSTGGLSQNLNFPYEAIRPAPNASNNTASEEYNFDTITVWNMLDSTNNPSGVTVTLNSDSYMYDPNENVIVIPADGWYKIDLTSTANLIGGSANTATVKQWTTTFYEDDEFNRDRNAIISGSNATLKAFMPLEIQLVRNYDENIELIKGKKNVIYRTGDPSQTTYTYYGRSYTGGTYQNKEEWETDYPHQDSYGSKIPTKINGLLTNAAINRSKVLESLGYTAPTTTGRTNGGRRAASVNNTGTIGGTIYNNMGFMHKDNEVMPYDQAVSPAFICGFSTMGDGTVSIMRDGYSWSNMTSVENKCIANVAGQQIISKNSDGSYTSIDTTYCLNTYKDSPLNFCSVSDYMMIGHVTCCVYLKKNDIVELMAVQRDFDGQVYSTSATCHLKMTAISQKSESELRGDNSWGYYSATDFPTKLNLFNFTNKSTKIQDWLTSIQKAFNLEFVMQGNDIQINTNKGIRKTVSYAVDVDDRVASDEAESEFISYPKEMSVKYKINTDEYGFELTVPEEHINDEGDEWKKWGDSGFTVIQLNDDSYETSKEETSTNFSYTYYMNFDFKQQHSGDTEDAAKVITIPIIELSEYMAEGYGYDDAMKHDGYSMTQRFWYKNHVSQDFIYLSDHMHETVYLMYPQNTLDNFNLSYKDTETSIATEYYNIHPMLASNYVTIEVYLTPEEYKAIKDGALVKFDDNLHFVSEISGYDPSGHNKTKLKLITKV